MSELKERIHSLIEKAAELPPDSASQAEIAAKFDPTEYSKTKPVRDALESFLNQLRKLDAETDEAELESAPAGVRAEILSHFESVRSAVDAALGGIMKAVPNVGPRRLQDSQFSNLATQVRTAETNLFKLFALFRTKKQVNAELLN